jgi:molybdate transport system substrate-binding protein
MIALLLAVLPARADVVVLAAASLTESLQKAGAAWTAQGHPPVTFSFDASSRLAKQVDEGVAADLYLSADRQWMDWLADRGHLDAGTRVDLVGNALVAVVPPASSLAGAADLAGPGVRHLALGGESVPAGRYARAALAALGAWEPVKDRVVSGDSVRTVLAWVAGGEAEAGVVYATDALVEPRVKVAFRFPATSHEPIVYPAAVLARALHHDDAVAFLRWLRSTEGLAIFYAAGFSPVYP